MGKNYFFQKPDLLERDHIIDDFDCGTESLNDYLKRYAYTNNRNHSSRTYVTCESKKVVGYYTITPGSVSTESAPLRVSLGLGRYPIPVIILARLAVDKEFQGMRLGEGLLKDALLRIVSASDSIGGRAILVHAKNNKAKIFYEKYGFEQSPIDEFHLYLLIKNIKKSFGI
ncbi:MAG: GNAT family N-acetyltransferase [bacterium]